MAIGSSDWMKDEVVKDEIEATCAGSRKVGDACKVYIKGGSGSHTAPDAQGKTEATHTAGQCYSGTIQQQDVTGTLGCRYQPADATSIWSANLDESRCAIEGDTCQTWTGETCIKGKLENNSKTDPTLVCRYSPASGDGGWLIYAGSILAFVGMVILFVSIVKAPPKPARLGATQRAVFPYRAPPPPPPRRAPYFLSHLSDPDLGAPALASLSPSAGPDSATVSSDSYSDLFNPLR